MPPRRQEKCKLPVPLPEGKVLDDMEGKQWVLGKMIGSGGFGLIYLAFPTSKPNKDARHVIKVEYQENGPLFSELKFYQRAAKKEYIRKWIERKQLDYLGIPVFYGFGLTEFKGRSYRFMVMERLGTDLQKILDQNGPFKKSTVLQLGIRMLDILEYIHENEYVHGDIKAANLLLGYTNPDRVYLADYGLSYRYCPNGNHKQYQENPRKGHNGTLEFTSLDAHKGVAPSRRSDVEILGYCMLRWLCGKLPWERNLQDPVAVQTAKANLLDELPESVLSWAPPESSCGELAQYLVCVTNLAYDEKPDYHKLKKILNPGGISLGPLEFSTMAQRVNIHTPTHQKVDSQDIETKPISEMPDKFTGQVYRKRSPESTAAQRQVREEGWPRNAESAAAHRQMPEEGQPRYVKSSTARRQLQEESQPRNAESAAAQRQENPRRQKGYESSELLNEVHSLLQKPRYAGFQTSFCEPYQGLTSTDRIGTSRCPPWYRYSSRNSVGVTDWEGPSQLRPAIFRLRLSEDAKADVRYYGLTILFLMISVSLALYFL